MISKDSIQFLVDLKKNNNREWFLANKKRYEAYKKEYYALAEQFIDALAKKDPALGAIQVKDVVFRINRDIRFSKDKSPYKTNMAFWVSPGNKNWTQSGYYVHVEPGSSFIAGGFHNPEAEDLKKIRKEIAFFHEDLDAILADKKFKEIYGDIDRENALKTVPKGYEKEHPAIELLKLKSFTATAKIDDKLFSDQDFVQKVSEKLLVLKPMGEFLNRALLGEE